MQSTWVKLVSLAVVATAIVLVAMARDLNSRELDKTPSPAGTVPAMTLDAPPDHPPDDPPQPVRDGPLADTSACVADDSCEPLGAGVAGLALESRCVIPTLLAPGQRQSETLRDRRVLGMPATCHVKRQAGAICSVRCRVLPEMNPRLLGPARETRLAESTDQLLARLRDRFGPERSATKTTRQGQLQRTWRWRASGEQLNFSAWQRLEAREADSRRDRHMAPRLSLVYSAP